MNYHPLYPSTEEKEGMHSVSENQSKVLLAAVGSLLTLCEQADFKSGVEHPDSRADYLAGQMIRDIIETLEMAGFDFRKTNAYGKERESEEQADEVLY